MWENLRVILEARDFSHVSFTDVYVDKTYLCQLPLRNGTVLGAVDNGN